MKYVKLILFAIVLFLLVVFAHYNQEPTTLVFFSYGGVTYQSYELPLFAFFYIVILITIIVISLLEVIERLSLRAKNRKLQKENTKLKGQLAAATQGQTTQPAPPAPPESPEEEPAPSDAGEKKKAPDEKKKRK